MMSTIIINRRYLCRVSDLMLILWVMLIESVYFNWYYYTIAHLLRSITCMEMELHNIN